MRIAFAVSCIVAGSLLVVYRQGFARFTTHHQNRFWGFRFGDKSVQLARLIVAAVGIVFVLLGLSFLLFIDA